MIAPKPILLSAAPKPGSQTAAATVLSDGRRGAWGIDGMSRGLARPFATHAYLGNNWAFPLFLLDRTEWRPTITRMGFNRQKLEDQSRAPAASRRATDAQVLEDAERLIAASNQRQEKRMAMLFSPTIGAAVAARYWFRQRVLGSRAQPFF
jgi:hypothetical protein